MSWWQYLGGTQITFNLTVWEGTDFFHFTSFVTKAISRQLRTLSSPLPPSPALLIPLHPFALPALDTFLTSTPSVYWLTLAVTSSDWLPVFLLFCFTDLFLLALFVSFQTWSHSLHIGRWGEGFLCVKLKIMFTFTGRWAQNFWMLNSVWSVTLSEIFPCVELKIICYLYGELKQELFKSHINDNWLSLWRDEVQVYHLSK